jgi:hypothetical protein
VIKLMYQLIGLNNYKHFEDGKPTVDSPDPTLAPGYESPSSSKPKGKPTAARFMWKAAFATAEV